MEQEVRSADEKDRQRDVEAEETGRNVRAEKSELSSRLNAIREDKRKSLDSLADLEMSSRREIGRLRNELTAEKLDSSVLKEKLALNEAEKECMKERNVELSTRIHQMEIDMMACEKKARVRKKGARGFFLEWMNG